MRGFDPATWRERAWDRLRSSLARGADKDDVERAWALDVLSIGDLARVVDWCNKRGVAVEFGKRENGVYDSATKTVVISAHARAKKQCVYLLHECGHFLIGDEEQTGRFSLGYAMAEDPRVKRTYAHKLACLEEEVEAWHRGWKLARRLKLTLTREDFDEVRVDCLKTYVKWVAKHCERKT